MDHIWQRKQRNALLDLYEAQDQRSERSSYLGNERMQDPSAGQGSWAREIYEAVNLEADSLKRVLAAQAVVMQSKQVKAVIAALKIVYWLVSWVKVTNEWFCIYV